MEAGAIDTRTPMELRALIAGVGAGIVGAAASIAAQVLMRAPYPHYNDTLGSAVAAGVAGGLLYAVLVRLTAAPDRDGRHAAHRRAAAAGRSWGASGPV